MINYKDTVISQYANSPTLMQLIESMNEYFDPSTNFKDFYNFVWNVDTARGFGLDVWGKIVNVQRELTILDDTSYLGFLSATGDSSSPDEVTYRYLAPATVAGLAYLAPAAIVAPGPTPTYSEIVGFNQGPFFGGIIGETNTYRLADEAYRLLILTKALANISLSTPASLNRLLRNLFENRGRAYIQDNGGMRITYVFEFLLRPIELAIITQSGAIPRPAAVSSDILQIVAPTTFSFKEANGVPYGAGSFYNPNEV